MYKISMSISEGGGPFFGPPVIDTLGSILLDAR